MCWHLVSPISQPYFKHAIMESGSCSIPEVFTPLERGKAPSNLNVSCLAYATGAVVKNIAGCANSSNVLTCLRDVPLPLLYPALDEWPRDGSPPLAPLIPYG